MTTNNQVNSDIKLAQINFEGFRRLGISISQVQESFGSPVNSDAKLLDQIEMADIDTIETLYDKSAPNSPERRRALRAWVHLATTLPQMEKISRKDPRLFNRHDANGQNKFAIKWRTLAARALMTTKTVSDIMAVYNNIPPDTPEAATAIRKLAKIFLKKTTS